MGANESSVNAYFVMGSRLYMKSGNKQKYLVNPAFMRVCGTFKSLLITN